MFYDQFCVHYREAFEPNPEVWDADVKGPLYCIKQVGCTGLGLTIINGIASWRDEDENLYEIPVADLIGVYPL